MHAEKTPRAKMSAKTLFTPPRGKPDGDLYAIFVSSFPSFLHKYSETLSGRILPARIAHKGQTCKRTPFVS